MLIINLEYLVAPLLCGGKCINDFAEDLSIIHRISQHPEVSIFKEEDIILKLTEANYFPSDVAFNSVLPHDIELVYSVNDIVKLINKVIGSAVENNISFLTHELEWGKQSVEPHIEFLNKKREEYYHELFKITLLNGFLSKDTSHILSFQKGFAFKSNVKYKIGTSLLDAYPEDLFELPHEFNEEIFLYSDIKTIINDINCLELYQSSRNDDQLKLSLYLGAIKFAYSNNIDGYISWDDFDIGESFFESLVKNQCAYEQNFSSTLYNILIKIICRRSEDLAVNKFFKSDDANEQRVYRGLGAYRCHITKHHEGLRLMFWVEPSTKRIILANVGPKMELMISKP